MIKVYIDQQPLKSAHAIRGIGSYTRNLLDALRNQKEVLLVESPEKADVIHYPYFDLFFNTLSSTRKTSIVTIFDTIPLIYPKEFPTGIKGKLSFWSQKGKLKRVDSIITISETSKKDIIRFLDVMPSKIHVIYLAQGKEFKKVTNSVAQVAASKYKLPSKFILYVGDVNYNKNVVGLIKAFACLKSNINLVLVGKAFENDIAETREIFHLIEKLKIKDKVLIPGFVPGEDLVSIYNLATVYCQPSLYEGFGLPVLEAMASGCSVVALASQALIEIGQEAALFADPKEHQDLASKLDEVINNEELRDSLIKKGLSHSSKFGWEKVAEETIKVYNDSLKND